MSGSLMRTPLYDAHIDMGGRIVPFAGWELPVQFTGIVEEHNHTRNACSVFDVSHMGRLKLTGRDCEAFLNRMCTLAERYPVNSADARIIRSDNCVARCICLNVGSII